MLVQSYNLRLSTIEQSRRWQRWDCFFMDLHKTYRK